MGYISPPTSQFETRCNLVFVLLILSVVSGQSGAAVLSAKRGFADTGASYSGLQATGAGWYYNWGAAPSNIGNFDANFSPMIWGWGQMGSVDYVLGQNPQYVLGFNEPERGDQANMSVNDAITNWTTISNSTKAYNTTHGTSIKLVSPAVADTVVPQAVSNGYRTSCLRRMPTT